MHEDWRITHVNLYQIHIYGTGDNKSTKNYERCVTFASKVNEFLRIIHLLHYAILKVFFFQTQKYHRHHRDIEAELIV